MIEEDGLAEALEWQGLSQERQLAYDRAVDPGTRARYLQVVRHDGPACRACSII